MRKIHQLLFLAGISGVTALSSCSRATYVFQPNTVTYSGDAAEARQRPVAAVAPAVPTTTPAVAAPPLAVPTAALPPKGLGNLKKTGKPHRIVRALVAQPVAASKMLMRAVKTLRPRQNTAEQTQTQSKARTFFLTAAAVLMAAGLVIFLATIAANPGLDTGVTLITIALVSFLAGLVLLITGLFQKK